MNTSGPTTGYHLYNTPYSLSYLINLFASTTLALFGLSASWFSLFLSFSHAPFPSSKNNQFYDHTYKTAMQILDIKFFPVTSLIKKALSLTFSSLAHSLLIKHGQASMHYSPYHIIMTSSSSNHLQICFSGIKWNFHLFSLMPHILSLAWHCLLQSHPSSSRNSLYSLAWIPLSWSSLEHLKLI